MHWLPALLVILAFLVRGPVLCQRPVMNEAAAKEAVHRIVQHSGLQPNFVVLEDPKVRSAVAYIKGGQRVIAYNPAFVSAILDSTSNDFSAVGILAHEIAHHLLGHTLHPDEVQPADELDCDRYSGFILFHMGASLEETLSAIRVAGDPHGNLRHPPEQAREQALREGWEDAEQLVLGKGGSPFRINQEFTFVVRFAGDQQTYFVDATGRLLWFDERSIAVEKGTCEPIPDTASHQLHMGDLTYLVDGHETIWRTTAQGQQLKVGRMVPFGN